jgi:hypothetical protein
MKKFTKSLMAVALVAVSGAAVAEETSFDSTISLLEPITLTTVQDLSFAPQPVGEAVDVLTTAADSRAAVFSATGEANAVAQTSVVEPSIEMVTGAGSASGERITVDTFTYGGSLATDGSTAFDGSGEINNMRVGATAHVEADDVQGDFVGTATFRLVYQ